MNSRDERVLIFQDTKKQFETDFELIAAVKESNMRQEVILQGEAVSGQLPSYELPAKVVVSRKRSFEAALGYEGQGVCVLNFASSKNPGGGVEWGSTAQEECLCRCSTLFANLIHPKCLDRFYYPHRRFRGTLYNDDCIYTPNVVVFKSDTAKPRLLPRDQWRRLNLITCAAPNLRPDRDGNPVRITDGQLEKLHIQRMERILQIAAAKGNEVVILGAYGCGAFKNPPEVVAAAMKKAVEKYKHHFRAIEFAVYCRPDDDWNYRVFRRVLN